MEFLSGYAAAKAPYASYQVEPHSPHSHRSKGPARANSTSGTTTKKRSRIPSHARTNSASTSSSGRTEHQPSPHSLSWLQQPPAGLDASGAGVDATPAIVTSGATGRALPRDQTRERMSAPAKYYQEKQLPATPRLNTQDAAFRYPSAGTTSEPASARTPASASATTPGAVGNPSAGVPSLAVFPDRRMQTLQHAAMFPELGAASKVSGSSGLPRAESVSSVSGITTASSRTMHSSEHHPSEAAAYHHRPFIVRNGRTYLSDPTLSYPLPVDLEEIHHQSLKTMLLMQLHGRPICSPAFATKPPSRVLEVGCGTGFWSMMCYRYYEERGLHRNVSFTGIDIVPIAPTSGGPGISSSSSSSTLSPSAAETDTRPDKDMNWRFVQHDIRKLPLPFPDASFDFVMVKDMGLATPTALQQGLMDEYIRILTPGGTVEIWETDHTIRMLRPHVPETPTTSSSSTTTTAEDGIEQQQQQQQQEEQQPSPDNDTDNTTTTAAATSAGSGSNSTEEDEHRAAFAMGAYVMTANTPLSTPLNNYLVEYNGWISRALDARAICPMPCTVIGPLLIQEAEALKEVGSRRLAVPLSEVRWEREGVGGVVTKDGKSYIETKARRLFGGGGKDGAGGEGGGGAGRTLNPTAAALRRTALMTVVGQIQSFEPVLREVSGKSQDEWDAWVGKMMNDLVRENGTSWGECLEVGAWWARKR
ncbi:Methyltransferase domain-containing protein [Madurella fahalii]|uniref:Methyltransferase domain-containing protein n=1 Tax=Madurella fahalii TaxID=1157608 RepID=A0ABQ0GAM0_9PEZI